MHRVFDLSRVGVVIPALNEALALPGVLEGLRQQGLTRIRVVDNGSTDDTAAVAAASGAEVVVEPRRGYGQACWTGLQNLPAEVEWILFCDADGSDDLDKLPDFVEAMEKAGADFILGDRRGTAESAATLTLPQRWGNALATALIRLGWGHRYHDLGPMRLVRRSALEKIAMEDRGFGWTIEMQIRAVEEGLRIREIPVNGRQRQAGKSKISGTIRGVMGAGSIILGTWAKFFLRKSAVQATLRLVSAALLCVGAGMVLPFGDFARLGVHPLFWTGAGFLSLGYALSWGLRSMSWLWLVGLAVGLRLILLPMFPGDDVWRYLWEGWVQNHGFNPYVWAPSSPELAHLRTPWWELVQHREITAIYPPLTQALMRLAVWGPGWWLLKVMIVVADLAVVAALAQKLGTVKASRYAWCPLVLVVFAGGAHFDSWLLLGMVAGWWLWERGRWRWAALALGVACGIKYVAAPLLAWMVWQLVFQKNGGKGLPPYSMKTQQGLKNAFLALGLAALPTLLAIAWLPGPWDPSQWLPRDFALYARSADLVPRLVSVFWEESLRLNPIYLLPVGIVGIWTVLRGKTMAEAAQTWFMGLLFFSPLVHGWYFTWALPFAAATGHWGWRMAGISALIYFQLQQTAFEEQDWMLTWPQWGLLWGPILTGWLWERFQPKEDA
jgi:glycosyltransferase involved in cell wall biosynthesis